MERGGLCGQACIARLAGISLDAAIAAVGHASEAGTTVREIRSALRRCGVACASRIVRTTRKSTLPHNALVRIRSDGETQWDFHWLLILGGEVYDPEGLWPDYYRDWRIFSFLEIYPQPQNESSTQ